MYEIDTLIGFLFEKHPIKLSDVPVCLCLLEFVPTPKPANMYSMCHERVKLLPWGPWSQSADLLDKNARKALIANDGP